MISGYKISISYSGSCFDEVYTLSAHDEELSMTCSDDNESSREVDIDLGSDADGDAASIHVESMLNDIAQDLSDRGDLEKTNVTVFDDDSCLADWRARDTLAVLCGLRDKLDAALKRNPSTIEAKAMDDRLKGAHMAKRMDELEEQQPQNFSDTIPTFYVAHELVTESTDNIISRDEEDTKHHAAPAPNGPREQQQPHKAAGFAEEEPVAMRIRRDTEAAPQGIKGQLIEAKSKWMPGRLKSSRKVFGQQVAPAEPREESVGPSSRDNERTEPASQSSRGTGSEVAGLGNLEMNKVRSNSKAMRLLSFKNVMGQKGSPVSMNSSLSSSIPKSMSRHPSFRPFTPRSHSIARSPRPEA
jgi:hypothetical protein